MRRPVIGLLAAGVPIVLLSWPPAPAPSAGTGAAPKVTRLTRDGSFKQHLSWSPDGKKILCTRIHQGKMGLWTADAVSGELKPLLPQVKTPHFDGHWSPDGKRVAFVWDTLQGTDGKLHIDTVHADGSDLKTLVPHQAFEESPRWSAHRLGQHPPRQPGDLHGGRGRQGPEATDQRGRLRQQPLLVA